MFVAASPQTLGALGDDVFRGASRSLQLLKAIEDTIASLCYDQRYYKLFASIAREAADTVRKSPREKALDPDGGAEQKLLKGQQAVRSLHDRLIEKRQYAISDPRLTDDDGVVDEYARTIQVVAEVHNAINNLRWAVSEHDADVRAKIGTKLRTYAAEDIEKLVADLKA